MKKDTQLQSEVNSVIDVLLGTLAENPDTWAVRKEAARLLFDHSRYKEAADIIWAAPEIPSIDLDIAFAARVLSRARPSRAIRLLNHVQEKCGNTPAKLLALANALMHYGMVLQAARFYGAATAQGDDLANGDLEHFMLWLDDSQRLWGDWEKDGQKMDELPWVKRDQSKETNEGDFKKAMSGLTTPIEVPGLKDSSAEHLTNDYYRQTPIQGAEITAPPAVTVPLDQLDSNDIIHDDARGASITRPIDKEKNQAKQPMTMQQIEKTSGNTLPPTLPSPVPTQTLTPPTATKLLTPPPTAPLKSLLTSSKVPSPNRKRENVNKLDDE